MNVKTGFSEVSSARAGRLAHVLALQVLIDFEDRARRAVVLDANFDVRIGVDQFVVKVPTDIYLENLKCGFFFLI